MQVKARKKKEEKKPQKAMDAGARGRRLLQRREYRAKVSEFIPKELEDHVVYEGDPNTNLFPAGTQQKVKRVLDAGSNFMKNNRVGRVLGRVFGSSRPGSNYTPGGKVTAEANSAQMKAMHDAQLKKKEDDKVASKKKDVKEGTKYGLYKGSGKASGAFKDYLDKKKKEKESKKEEVELEAKKSCGEGEYYCHDEQKCKPIPDGMKVGKDGMLVKEDMKGMSQKSGDKRSTESGAGMTAKGVAKYNRRTGGNLKTAVTTPPSKLKPGSKAAKRRKSFCARSRSWTGPRGKAARRRWNCSYEPELPMIIDEKKKLFNTAPLSTRVSNWSKNIKEASPLTPGRNVVGLPNLKSIEKKIKNKNTGRMNTGGDGTAYRGEQVVQEMPDDIKGAIMTNLRGGAGDFAKGGNIKNIIRNRLKSTAKDVINTDTVKKTLNIGEMATFNLDDLEKSGKKYYDLTNPRERAAYSRLKKAGKNPLIKKVDEAKMTSAEKDKKEKYVKGMKKVKGDFTKRYGKDGKSVMYATATKMAMKKEETLVEKPGDGYIGPTVGKVGIPNPIRIAKDAVDQMNRANLKKVNTVNKISPGSATMPKFNQFNKDTSDAYKNLFQSHEPEGEMTEAKYEKGASTYGKASIRNKRMFGKGGNAADPKERGAAITVRRARHQERRYVKKGNKYHEPGKHRPEVHGVNKPEEERKGKNIKEGSLHKWFKGSKSKDGKPGWVNVVTGGTCASDKPGEGTPKCVSSSKRASMTKAERLSASRRKKKADPGQQSKSGAAKPTYVATDKKKKVDEMNQGPSTPVGNYDGKIMPKFGAGRIGNVRLKGGKSIADLLKKP